MLNMIADYTIFVLFLFSLLFIIYTLFYRKEALQIKGDLSIALPKPLQLVLEINIIVSIIISLIILLILLAPRFFT